MWDHATYSLTFLTYLYIYNEGTNLRDATNQTLPAAIKSRDSKGDLHLKYVSSLPHEDLLHGQTQNKKGDGELQEEISHPGPRRVLVGQKYTISQHDR